MIDDFYVIERDKTVLIPEDALNGSDLSYFINHSASPNVKTIDGGCTFVTVRKIKENEELTVAYGTYDDKFKKNDIVKKIRASSRSV